MKLSAKILLGIIVVLLVIQLFRPERNSGEIHTENYISQVVPLPSNVENILKTSCFDCHSNNTTYPWYINIQPLGWWLADHIKEGKKELNFSEFKTYPLKRQHHKLEEIIEEVDETHMPISSYLLMHEEAKLTDEEKAVLLAWAKENMAKLQVELDKDNQQ